MNSLGMNGPQVAPSRSDVDARRRARDAAIFRGILATAVVRVLSAGASLATLAIAARSLGKVEFGFVATLVSIWMILTMVDLGVGGSLTTRVARAHGLDDPAAIRLHVKEAVDALSVIGFLLAGVGCISVFVLPWGAWLGAGQSPAEVAPAIVLMFITAGASIPGAVGIATLAGRQRLATARLMVGAGSLATLATAGVAASLHLPPWSFVLAILGCPTLASLCVTAWVILCELPGATRGSNFELRRVVATLRASSYFAVANSSNAIALGTGTLIIATVEGAGAAAVFSVASRMFAVIFTIVSQSGAQVWPALTEAIARKDLHWALLRYRRSVLSILAITSTASIVLAIAGRTMARIWVGPALVPTTSLLVWQGVLTTLICAAAQASTLLLATERVRPLAGLCVANAVVGTGAAVLLSRKIGLLGPAVGGSVSCVAILVPGIALTVRRSLRDLSNGGEPERSGGLGSDVDGEVLA